VLLLMDINVVCMRMSSKRLSEKNKGGELLEGKMATATNLHIHTHTQTFHGAHSFSPSLSHPFRLGMCSILLFLHISLLQLLPFCFTSAPLFPLPLLASCCYFPTSRAHFILYSFSLMSLSHSQPPSYSFIHIYSLTHRRIAIILCLTDR
jgi:hypothetical protein